MNYFNINGSTLLTIYDINGIPINVYPPYSNDYEKAIYNAKNEWINEAKTDANITPIIVHTDQHGRLNEKNTLFPYLGKIISFDNISACIGLGDVSNYSESAFKSM